ncbi:MAG TPA: hypothetical protein VKM56_10365 [Verrucomicrobiae bacterium]|nr:hypothetical protein [Verrucomicrobiae bacterium]
MKRLKSLSFSFLLITAADASSGGESFRTDINPALRYYQAYLVAPDLSQADRDYLVNREWRGQTLPVRFGELLARYDKEFGYVRAAAHATVPCDWGIDMSPGPATLLPQLARNKAVAQTARLRAMWDLQHGNQTDARDDLLAALALARNCSRDGTLISVLVQIAMENIIFSAVAQHFYQFTPETLRQIIAGFDAAPARGTVAACIPTERAFFQDWLMSKIVQLQKDNPGNDAKVMDGIQKVVASIDIGEEGQTGLGHLSEDVTKAAGGTSAGIVKLLREAQAFSDRLAPILSLPYSDYEEQMKLFTADVHKSQNPWVSQLFPAWEKCRTKEFGSLIAQQMVRAAVEYKLHGEAAFKNVSDPCGQGPFGFERFTFEGVDRGFQLKSAYTGRGFPEIVIFVEKDGPPFQVNGNKAGRPVPASTK